MGRWSQRRRAGGGGAGFLPTGCIPITEVGVLDADTVLVTFAEDIDAADFSGSDLNDDSSGGIASAVVQEDTNQLEFTGWSQNCTPTETFTLTTTAPGVCSPQTVISLP